MKRFLFKALFVISLLVITPEVNSENTNQWLGTKQLNENYVMFWKRDDSKEELVIRVEVKTRGWVGFGFSKHGMMEMSDLAIGWVSDEGKTYFHDRWTDRKEMPVIDKSQDWLLISGLQNSSHTVLQFKRPYKTCDTLEDVEVLETEHQNIIWSYSDTDPMNDQNIHKHDNKGIEHLRLLDPVIHTEPTEDDLEVYDIKFENLPVPKAPLKYFCKFFKFPFKQPRHIVKCGPVTEPTKYSRFVFHTMFSHWDPLNPSLVDKYIDQVFECEDMPEPLKESIDAMYTSPCNIALIQTNYYAPPEAGVKVTADPYTTYAMLQIHVENPKNIEGIVVNQSMRIWHTGQLRQYDLEKIAFGSSVHSGYTGFGIMIPPREPHFVQSFIINTFCFEDLMDPNGLTIDSIRVHTHKQGIQIHTRHIRGDKELEPFVDFVHYDPSYQAYNKVKRDVKIMQGDLILIECHHNNSLNNEMLVEGDEICTTMFVFYPPLKRRNHTKRFKTVKYNNAYKLETVLRVSNLEQIDGYYDTKSPVVRLPMQYNGTNLVDYLKHKKEWIHPRELERVLYDSPRELYCIGDIEPEHSTNDRITIEVPRNYTSFEKKYRQCQSNCGLK